MRGAMIGSFEILIGPLDEILRGLFEIVMMAKSSSLLIELLMVGIFSNRISRLFIRHCTPFFSSSHPFSRWSQQAQFVEHPGNTPAFSKLAFTMVKGVVKSLTEAIKVSSSMELTPFSMFWHWRGYQVWSRGWTKLNRPIFYQILNFVLQCPALIGLMAGAIGMVCAFRIRVVIRWGNIRVGWWIA